MRRTGPAKVLIVDDSPLVRSILSSALSEENDIQVVGGAKDPYEAREHIIAHRPDVIILDIEMPRMDGLTFLKKLRAHYPVPVIMCSGVAADNSQTALEALEAGAVDVVAKPTSGGSRALRRLGQDLADKIRAACVAMPPPPPIPASAASKPLSFRDAGLDPSRYLIAIGASTGGTEAIRQLLCRLPPDCPPVAIVQHMPEGFTRSFAERLNQLSPLTVAEAVDGSVLASGRAFLGRGGIQMSVRSVGGQRRIAYGTDELVNRHCPSVDVLFESVARQVGKNAVGIILTGMGRDGAAGLRAMRDAGAVTVAQDRASSVVYGMPMVATEMGAVQHSAAPSEIARTVLKALCCRDAPSARRAQGGAKGAATNLRRVNG